MFDPFKHVGDATGLGLPDNYDVTPIVELVRTARAEGVDEALLSANEEMTALLAALRSIVKTTTDPVARATASRALDNHTAVTACDQ
ncbi:TPA: hypothetical protein NIA45_004608 [Pseudomonas aeruginosa]|nr:hypothetical protein [Pseudomonas aeruginosa]